MVVQQAAFTIHRDAKDLRETPVATEILRKFTVRAESKGHIRSSLKMAGISGASLFPDLSALADELRDLGDLIG
jgi:hypothetical protein